MKPSFVQRQDGSSLIEVLIALGLVAVTMLGLLAMQLRTLGLQKDSLDRRSAAVLVGSFADRVGGNFTGFRDGNYDGLAFAPGDVAPDDEVPPVPAPACAVAAPCTPAQVAARDWALFRIDVRNRLPGGVAFVETADSDALITVGWSDPRRTDAAAGGEAAGTFDPVCVAAGLSDDSYRCYAARVTP